MPPPTDDRTLVAGAQSGDQRALNDLLARHLDRIHAVCARIVGRSRDADDAAQNAMINIVRSLDRFDGRSAFSTWAYRIATNAALDELRKRNRRPQLHSVTGADDPNAAPPEPVDPLSHRQVEGVVDRLAIDEALASLPDDFRAAVVLCDITEMGYAEISETLGVPLGTVKSRVARGRAMLIDKLRNPDPSGDVQTTSPPYD